MRHRPGWGWLLATLAACALAAAVVLTLMAVMRPVGAAELTLMPGELSLLTRVVYHEARSDGLPGMVAVAHVALNRREEPERFGKTLHDVLVAPHQFAQGPASDDSDVAWLLAVYAASGAVLGRLPDVTDGSTHFHRADMPRPPKWARGFTRTAQVGRHVFYRAGAE